MRRMVRWREREGGEREREGGEREREGDREREREREREKADTQKRGHTCRLVEGHTLINVELESFNT